MKKYECGKSIYGGWYVQTIDMTDCKHFRTLKECKQYVESVGGTISRKW